MLPYSGTDIRLTSPYGTRSDPFTGASTFHGGIDLVGSTDKNVVSVADGVVVTSTIITDPSNKTSEWGNYIAVYSESDGRTRYYCHLDSRSVSAGDKVTAGQVIGVEGSSGRSTGSHLHYEVRVNGKQVNAADDLGIANSAGTIKSQGTVKPTETPVQVVDLYNQVSQVKKDTQLNQNLQLAPAMNKGFSDFTVTDEDESDMPAIVFVDGIDITSAVSALTFDSSLDSLGDCLKFSIPYSDIAKYNIGDFELGLAVRLNNGNGVMVFEGIITSREHQESVRSYTCYDFCYYLNKSKIFIQFDAGITVSDAIKDLWGEIGVSYQSLPPMSTVIESEKTTYFMESPADILRKLLDMEEEVSGREYYAYASGYNRIEIDSVGSIETRFVNFDSISDPKYSQNLDEVRNSAMFIVGSDEEYSVFHAFTNPESINKYGLIREIITGETTENALKMIGTVIRKQSIPLGGGNITVLGHWSCTRGRRLTITEPVTGLTGVYVIRGVTHTVDTNIPVHLMTLDLKEYNNL